MAYKYCRAIGLGLDISKEALIVAEKNSKLLGQGHNRASFSFSDIHQTNFTSQVISQWIGFNGGFVDVYVSNPPYIPTKVAQYATNVTGGPSL